MKTIQFNGSIKFILSLLLLLVGCGGGTTGTGGTGSSDYNGRVLTDAGSPVSGALVTLLESGDSSSTDSNGSFSIPSDIDAPSVTLLVESEANQGQVVVDELPSGPKEVSVEVTINRASREVKLTSKRVRPKSTPTPISGSSAVPTESPTIPSGTPIPGSTPTVNPSPTPNDTQSPSPTETPVPKPKTVFRGKIRTNTPSLLTGAIVGIAARQKRSAVASDGSFRFSVNARSDNTTFIVEAAGQTFSVELSGVTASTKKAILTLRLDMKKNGTITFLLKSIKLQE